MRLRRIWFASAAIMALLGAYYAGYRQGLDTRLTGPAPPALAAGGEAERVRDVPSPRGPLHSIGMPIYGIKPSDILDTFTQARSGGKRHEATDIMAPRGTPIHAVEDGTIKKLFLSKAGGNTIYEFDPDGVYCFYYAHLDHYFEGLHEGTAVTKGDVIGYVGSTGDASAEAPHLHFAIMKLGPDKKWWQGTAINPYPILIQALRGRSS